MTTISLDPRLSLSVSKNHHHHHGVVMEEIEGLIRVYKDGHVERPPIVPNVSVAVASELGVTAKDVVIDKFTNLWARFYVTNCNKKLPLLVYFHGGGFCVGSSSWSCYHDFLAKLASKAGCLIMSVNYRLAPENRLPAAYEDGFKAVMWVKQQAMISSNELKWWLNQCNISSMFLAGDSAGANIAHHVATQLGSLEPSTLKPLCLKGTILIQPFFGGEARTQSEKHAIQPSNSALSASASDTYWQLSLPVGANRDHPWCNPLAKSATKLGDLKLPPTMICISDMDILKDRNLEFCAAMSSAVRRTSDTAMEDKLKLVILYGSQTGNALDAAERLGREAERRGCPVTVLSVDEFDASSLPNEKTLVFVVSTTGQGDTPDSMKVFWRFLLQRNLGQHWLDGVHYAVFGLGDSGYQKYNLVAKKLDKRLADLGAVAIVERGLGDDQHPSGYEGALDPWMSSLWKMLYLKNPKFFPKGPDFVVPEMKLMDQPKIQITYHDVEKVHTQFSTTTDLKSNEMQIERARSMSPGKFSHDKNRPDCFLKMIRNDPLTRADSGKDVRHFEFEVLSSVIEYEVGDVLEVLPGQSPVAVDAFIQRCNLNPNSYITVHPRGTQNHIVNSNVPIQLKTFVELTMDVASASPRRYLFEVMSFFASAQHEKERLQYFASPEGRDDLYQYNQKERRTVLEVLEDFPSVQMPFEWLVQLVPTLKTRAFSISSSHSAHPNQVHLTVNVVSWTTPFKRKRTGLCSAWLAGLDPQQRVNIPVWFRKGSLPVPPPSLPLILIGPGTGCAPFRGFVEERALQSISDSTAPVLFFFGCRNEDNDFLYRDFWLSHSQNGGVLSEDKGGGFYVAFSRDQPQKVYVQHKMQEHSKRVWNLLSNGATVYVAGSSTKMPSDVFTSFEEIISKECEVPQEAAMRWLRTLEKAGALYCLVFKNSFMGKLDFLSELESWCFNHGLRTVFLIIESFSSEPKLEADVLSSPALFLLRSNSLR
ncbi:hypothetical protein F0562_004240 [Nyssa sinensis]|uniref:NADPH-dependent diflavin oxidoreductase 1 n=1 Tax=Nyssa sinensis TaxID=561372 RepID=A0A5J5C2Q1_9ASTE|nr:hypothetical protein F0562_004240 [Nyssa sinensis]